MQDFRRLAAKNGAAIQDSGPCQFCGAPVEGGAEACLRLLDELSERTRAEKSYAQAHLFSVDAHALQHPELHGRLNNPVHLLSLCLMLERGSSAAAGSRKPAVEKFLALGRQWPPLEAPPAGYRGILTAKSVLEASAAERALVAREWAEEVWQVWQPHHPWTRRMLDRLAHD
ncbi:MAG TPA: DUF5946 family protein [Patescibacteria group bacterium]|nr:DUF5946 family protein [Patescibacteria group bacterium]